MADGRARRFDRAKVAARERMAAGAGASSGCGASCSPVSLAGRSAVCPDPKREPCYAGDRSTSPRQSMAVMLGNLYHALVTAGTSDIDA